MIRVVATTCLCFALCACVTTGTTTAIDNSGLVGMADAQLRASFGQPSFVRQDGVAQIWRYDGASCRAFFFLYGNNGAYTVKRVETLPHSSMSSADSACLASLQTKPAAKRS